MDLDDIYLRRSRHTCARRYAGAEDLRFEAKDDKCDI